MPSIAVSNALSHCSMIEQQVRIGVRARARTRSHSLLTCCKRISRTLLLVISKRTQLVARDQLRCLYVVMAIVGSVKVESHTTLPCSLTASAAHGTYIDGLQGSSRCVGIGTRLSHREIGRHTSLQLFDCSRRVSTNTRVYRRHISHIHAHAHARTFGTLKILCGKSLSTQRCHFCLRSAHVS